VAQGYARYRRQRAYHKQETRDEIKPRDTLCTVSKFVRYVPSIDLTVLIVVERVLSRTIVEASYCQGTLRCDTCFLIPFALCMDRLAVD
jgi:hypothetical protein